MRKSEISGRRGLSARIAGWQSGRGGANPRGMVRFAFPLMLAATLAGPAAAVPGGEIGTLAIGRYVCELPGDALAERGKPAPDADFRIIRGSSYRVGKVTGTYLLTGDQMVMTSGPHDGKRYRRLSQRFLRLQNRDGGDGDLRCVVAHRSNS